MFLVFHPHWLGKSTLDSNSDWRDRFIKQLLDDNDVPYIWTKDIYRQDTKNKDMSFDSYIIPDDGHPTTYFNELIAEEMKRHILENQ